MRNSFLYLIFLIYFTIWIQVVFAQNEPVNTAAKLESDAENAGLKWNYQSISNSIEIYLEASKKWKETNQKDRAANCLREIGKLWLILGDKTKSDRAFFEALQLSRGFEEEESKIYSDLSLLALELGQIDKCRIYFEKALRLAKKTHNPQTLAMAYFSAGEFYYFRNNIENSIDSYNKSLEFWRKTEDIRGEAKTLLSLGYLYQLNNEFESSFNYLDSALEKWKIVKDERGEALTLKTIGTIYKLSNQHQKALEFFQQAEKLYPFDVDLSEKASLYNWFGSIYEEYGDWKLSFIYRDKALKLFETDQHIYGQLATLPSLGKLCRLMGDDISALEYFDKAESFARQIKDKFYLAMLHEEKGNIYFGQNDYKKALHFYNQAIILYQKNIYQKQLSRVYNKLGQIYEKMYSFSKAENYYNFSLNSAQNVKYKFGEAESLYNLSRINSLTGKSEKALKIIENSINISETLSLDVLNSKLKSAYFSSVYEHYELFIKLLMKMPQSSGTNYSIQALQASERSRARSMLETLTLSEANIIKDVPPETIKKEKEIRSLLNLKTDKLTDLLNGNSNKSQVDKITNEINELQNQLEQIKAELKQNSSFYSAIKNPEPFNIEEFQNEILDEDSLLLEFSLGRSESYLWVVGKNEVSSYILPARAEIESKVEILRQLIGARVRKKDEDLDDHQARITGADNEFPETARQLSRMLFGQIADKLTNKRLIIVPDGKLHYLPVSALPFPNSGTDEPILLVNEVIYEPSASTLVLIAKNQKQIKETSKNLLVFSDPVFTEEDSRFSGNTEIAEKIPENGDDNLRFAETLNSLPRLSGSKDEGDSIINIAGDSNSDIFTGFAATREQFLAANVSDYKILHFATHGLINETRPELSGIIFSRFSEKREKLDEFIRLQDIYSLNLNADLVVLSACETGVGKEEKGEGLLSLNNAFLQVGAKTVLSSFWKVEDAATVELMKNFYQIMAEEKTTSSKALQKAQKKMWESGRYKSPFYWAAFTMQGDFRRVPEISSNRNTYTFFLLIILPVIFIIGIFAFFKSRKGKKIISR